MAKLYPARLDTPMFTGAQLRALIIPLVIEQLLTAAVGVVDTLMVAQVGEAAMSGVALINTINTLLLNVFAALSTGGAIVTAQYLGRRDTGRAKQSATQMLMAVTALSILVTIICVCFRNGLFRVIYGTVEIAVRDSALPYFLLTALSYPAISIFNACGAVFRCMGNSKLPMTVSLIMNLINAVGNAIFIFLCSMGAAGAALSTLISRVFAACVLYIKLRNPALPVNISGLFPLRWDWSMVRRILSVGVPTGIENGIFQLGKLMVQSFISSLGTASIAANALMDNITSMTYLPAMAIGMALVTVAGQCVGAGKHHQARRYTVGFTLMAAASYVVLLGLVAIFLDPIVSLYNVSAQAAEIGRDLLFIIALPYIFIWPVAFTLPNALRAAGDARFTMVVAVSTMWIFRVGLGWLLSIYFGLGVSGVWYAMAADWLFRAICYFIRFVGTRWEQHHILDTVEEPS